MNKMIRTIGFAVFAAVLAVSASAQTSEPAYYPLTICPVSGDELGSKGDVVRKLVEGREIKFCSKECSDKFDAAKAETMAKMDKEIIATQSEVYPLTTCVVTGKSIEGGVDHLVKNRLFKLCSEDCRATVDKDVETYLAKLDAAVIKEQTAAYPAHSCPVTRERLGSMGEPYNYVFAGQLVRFCCEGCIVDFNLDPHQYMKLVYHEHGDHSGHNH